MQRKILKGDLNASSPTIIYYDVLNFCLLAPYLFHSLYVDQSMHLLIFHIA